MSRYQVFLLIVLVLWPFVILGLLFAMSKLETYVEKPSAETPQEAGLEPVEGHSDEKEVRIIFGDKVIGEPD
jgi:NADH:ubiquinone oxidoreductase subunit 3 (subunit A)